MLIEKGKTKMPIDIKVHGPYTQEQLIGLLPEEQLKSFGITAETDKLAREWASIQESSNNYLEATGKVKEEYSDREDLISFVEAGRVKETLHTWNRFLILEQYSKVSLLNIDTNAPSVEHRKGVIQLDLRPKEVLVVRPDNTLFWKYKH